MWLELERWIGRLGALAALAENIGSISSSHITHNHPKLQFQRTGYLLLASIDTKNALVLTYMSTQARH